MGPSHRRVRSVPVGIASLIATAVLTTHEVRERSGWHAAAHQSVLARSAIAHYTRVAAIESPVWMVSKATVVTMRTAGKDSSRP